MLPKEAKMVNRTPSCNITWPCITMSFILTGKQLQQTFDMNHKNNSKSKCFRPSKVKKGLVLLYPTLLFLHYLFVLQIGRMFMAILSCSMCDRSVAFVTFAIFPIVPSTKMELMISLTIFPLCNQYINMLQASFSILFSKCVDIM